MSEEEEKRQVQVPQVLPPKTPFPNLGSAKDLKKYGGKQDGIGKTVEVEFDYEDALEMKTDLTADQVRDLARAEMYIDELGIRGPPYYAEKFLKFYMMLAVSKGREGRNDLRHAADAYATYLKAQAQAQEQIRI